MESLEDKLLQIAQNNPDGFTYFFDGREAPKHGYSVAITQGLHDKRGLEEAIKMVDILGLDGVGGWLNKETGQYYFDAIRFVEDLEDAKFMGECYDQLCIYSFKDEVEIWLNKNEINWEEQL